MAEIGSAIRTRGKRGKFLPCDLAFFPLCGHSSTQCAEQVAECNHVMNRSQFCSVAGRDMVEIRYSAQPCGVPMGDAFIPDWWLNERKLSRLPRYALGTVPTKDVPFLLNDFSFPIPFHVKCMQSFKGFGGNQIHFIVFLSLAYGTLSLTK